MSETNNVPANKPAKKTSQSSSPWPAIATIIAAIITCIGTVIVAALNPDLTKVIFEKFDSPTFTPIPTSSVPRTDTPSNTPTIIDMTDTPKPLLLAGEDWKENCISAINWQPYLADKKTDSNADCYNLIPWGIAASNGRLLFTTTSHKTPSAVEYGIFTTLVQREKFQFSIHVNELSKSEVWLGFFEESSLQSDGILIAIQVDDNFDVRNMPSQAEFADNIHLYSEGGDYEKILIKFVGPSIYVTVDGQPVVADYPINISPSYLFLGYRMLPKGEIKAIIRNIIIQ